MPKLSSKAVVSNPAALANDVTVGPFSYLGPDVSADAGVVIANNVTVLGRTHLGAQCRLFPGCIVGAPADGNEATAGVCRIGARNMIREHVTIEAGTPGSPGTQIGPNNLLMVGCHVGHDAVLDGDGIFPNFTRIEHHAHVERYVWTAGFTGIGPYVTVGGYTFITGYAHVDRDVPPFSIAQGIPFRVRGVNTKTLRRCGFSDEAIGQLKHAFRDIFDGNDPFPPADRLARAEGKYGDEHVRTLIARLRRSAASPAGKILEPAGATE